MDDNNTNEILKEILKWQILQGKEILRELIPKLLDNNDKKRVYEMTDGIRTSIEIKKVVGVSDATVSNWWNIWYSFGILEKEGRKYKKIISLKDIGIDI